MVHESRSDGRPNGAERDTKRDTLGDRLMQGMHSAEQHAKEFVEREADEQKRFAVDRIETFAHSVHDVGETLERDGESALAHLANSAADQLDDASAYLRERNLEELAHDASDFARRHPQLVLCSAIVCGVILGRFLGSSGDRMRDADDSHSETASRPDGSIQHHDVAPRQSIAQRREPRASQTPPGGASTRAAESPETASAPAAARDEITHRAIQDPREESSP